MIYAEAFTNFSQKLEMCATGAEFPFTLQLRDPLAGSFIGPRLGLSVENDPHLTVMDYERTFDEDEELGLHDIQVDDWRCAARGESQKHQNAGVQITRTNMLKLR